MRRYTYRIVLYEDIIAEDEDDALEIVETKFKEFSADEIDLYEVDSVDPNDYMADMIYERRRDESNTCN